MNEPVALPHSPPLVIGATGGSGTRVIARIARHAGYNLGAHLNGADDSLDFVSLHDTWINRVITAGSDGAEFPEALKRDFQAALSKHLSSTNAAANERWGWKAPRSIYLLPFLRAQFPGMRFIHVLRDGRDMALSKNQNQLRKHGRAVLRWWERWFFRRSIRSILLWHRINARAADFGEAQLGSAYLRIRFEDLCGAPVETTARILEFLSASVDPEEIARAEISPPKTLGRWQTQRASHIAAMQARAGESLRRFGYLDAPR